MFSRTRITKIYFNNLHKILNLITINIIIYSEDIRQKSVIKHLSFWNSDSSETMIFNIII
jgi:hypothetical protein